MIMKKRKKLSAIILSVVMILSLIPVVSFADVIVDVDVTKGYNGEELPVGPDMSGTVINVTPENAQYTLDGAYGDINGKTINFTSGIYNDTLVLARATKYPGSKTLYYNMKWLNNKAWVADDNPVDSPNKLTSAITTYKRTLDGVTFTSDKDVTLPGFIAGSGHTYQNAYDYVKEKPVVSTNESNHADSSLKNLSFRGLRIKDGFYVNNYGRNAVNSNLTFDNCVFIGDEKKMSINEYKGISLKADDKYYENIVVKNCKFNNYFQGIYAQGINNAEIMNNEINGTTHNAISLQNSEKNTVKGKVDVKENYIENAKDRAIRLGDADSSLALSLNNNIMINSGDADGELFKSQSKKEGTIINLENNYWDGKPTDVAVSKNDESHRPFNIGINGGKFRRAIKREFCAPNFNPVERPDGTFGVCDHITKKLVNQKNPTCKETGYTGDTICENCGITLGKGEVIKKVDHSFKDGKCIFCGIKEKIDNAGTNENVGNTSNDGNKENTQNIVTNNKDKDKVNSSNVQTGDNNNIILYSVIAIIAICLLSFLFLKKKSK